LNNPFDISVIIPTYNRKHSLPRALDSVLYQSLTSLEIIVIDDGSTDETSGWIESEYPSVKLIRQSNSGVSSARNTGIKRANGEWIALLDSDDEWLPKKLEKQFQSLMENPDYLFCHTNEIWIRKGVRVNQGKKHQKYGGMIFEKCLDMCRISPSSSLFHKSILEEVGIFDESLKVCEDYDLWLRITAKYPVLFLDEPMIIKYGGHEDQLSKVKDGIEKYRIQSLEKLLLDDGLSKTQNHQVTHRLIKKYKIYANGLKKRGKIEEYESVMKKLHYLN